MKLYVMGLLFDTEENFVVLINKNHGPSSVIGKLNGPGGKVDNIESIESSIERKYLEETGLTGIAWNPGYVFGEDIEGMPDSRWQVDTFHARAPLTTLMEARTMTDEEIGIYSVGDVLSCRYVIAPYLRNAITCSLTGELPNTK